MKPYYLLNLLLLTVFIPEVSAQNNAVSFNGVNNYVDIPSSLFTDGASNFTIELWVKPNASNFDGNYHGVIGGQHPVSSRRSPSIWIHTSGQVHLDSYQFGTDVRYLYEGTTDFFVTNVWTHLAWVKSGTTYTLYRNGNLITSYTAPAQVIVPANYTLGKVDNLFSGSLDEVRFWNIARTGDEIREHLFNKSLSNSTSGLVAYYKCNEGLGTNLSNSCTNSSGIDGTLVNSPVWVSSPVQWGSNSLDLDGTSDHVTLPAGVYFNDNTFTIEAWVYAKSHGNYTRALDFGNGASNNNIIFNLSENSNGKPGLTIMNAVGTSEYVGSSTAIPLNTWTHVAAVLNGTTGKIYINGAETGSGSFTLSPANVSRSLNYIGRSNWVADDFANIMIDEFRIWTTARTQPELQNNLGKELNPSSQANLLVYYTFNQGNASGSNGGLTSIQDQKGNYSGNLVNFNLTGGSSNFSTQYSSLFSLPIFWQSFTAMRKAETIELQWTIADQTNCRDYEVQHSLDGNNWVTMSTQIAKTGTGGTITYSYKMKTPAGLIHYFRIKQNDLDGRSSYSVTRIIRLTVTSVMKAPGIAPGGRFVLETESAMELSVFGIDGRKRFNIRTIQGVQSMDWSFLEAGVYLIKTLDQSSRIIITK